MKCRPTLLILVITLAGAAGLKLVMQPEAIDTTLTSPTQHQNTTPQTSIALALALALTKSTAYDTQQVNLSFNQQHTLAVHYSANADTQFPESSKQLTPSSKEAQTPISVYQLLADQRIFLTGIDSSSSHVDALFATYFDQTDSVTEQAIEIILGDWAKVQPAEAWQWISSNDTTGLLHRFRTTIAQHWLPLDTDAALLAIMNLQSSDEKNQMLADYAAFIAVEEPDRAFYWAYGLTNETSRRQALDRVVYEWASSNPEQVILHLNSIIEPELRQQMLFQAGPTITAQLTQTNPQRAMMWTSSLNKYENEFLSPIAFQQWVNRNPDEAINWLAAENNNVNNQLYMASAATTLPYQNLAVAMEVFPTMHASVREDMASAIAFSLYQVNPNDAQIWSNNLQDPTLQINANRGILLATVDTEPEIALRMALDYHGQDQEEVLVNTAIEVDQQHPSLLENWLLTAPLDETQVHKIRAALVRSPAD